LCDLVIEEDIIAHLFNASEQRLARMLLLLARDGKRDGPRAHSASGVYRGPGAAKGLTGR